MAIIIMLKELCLSGPGGGWGASGMVIEILNMHCGWFVGKVIEHSNSNGSSKATSE